MLDQAITTIDIDTITDDWQLKTAANYVDWSEIRIDDPMERRERFHFAGCTLSSNPALADGTLDDDFSGKITLAQSPDGGPVWIKAKVEGMPQENRGYAFAINELSWNGTDCASSGGHWNPTNEVHGRAESSPSHVGDLLQLNSSLGGSVQFFQKASRPMLSGFNSVIGKTIAIYENPDDMG